MSRLPLADYALLSDCHSAALVSRSGSVDWLCFPRFDSPSVFGRLLGEAAGHWAIGVAGKSDITRRYVPGTMVLETIYRASSGVAVLHEALAVGPKERGHELGKDAPHALLRRIRCVEGEIDVELEYAPRMEYGLVPPLLTACDSGLLARGGAATLMLSSPVELTLDGSAARARCSLRAGETVAFAAEHRPSWEPAPEGWTARKISRRLDDTVAAWQSWSELHQKYRGPWCELVHHSGRVLQALTYHPTGALIAAPTTSLPEAIGGGLNWDYRFCWVRDASLTMQALWVAACPDEAEKFFGFLAHAALPAIRSDEDVQVVFGVGGEHDLTERELPHLGGWRDSRPVRVGNDAWTQRQLDVYGEALGAAYRLREQLGDMDPLTCEFLVGAADTAAARWREPDQGIWEFRGEPRHYLNTKLMCWVALDRAVLLGKQLRADDRVAGWAAARDEIRRVILEQGWNEKAGAYTQVLGAEALDASALVMPIVGFLPAADPRMLATINAIADRLIDKRGLLYRYRATDESAGKEGTFVICTFWLAQALALAGEVGRARQTFERAAAFANDVGLLAEEVDSDAGEMIGNFPQAFSHVGLINAAWAISQSEAAADAAPAAAATAES